MFKGKEKDKGCCIQWLWLLLYTLDCGGVECVDIHIILCVYASLVRNNLVYVVPMLLELLADHLTFQPSNTHPLIHRHTRTHTLTHTHILNCWLYPSLVLFPFTLGILPKMILGGTCSLRAGSLNRSHSHLHAHKLFYHALTSHSLAPEVLFNILPQSSRDFDPEAHLELKIPPDRSEILGNIVIDLGKNQIKNHEISRNDPECWSGTKFRWSGEDFLVFRMTEVLSNRWILRNWEFKTSVVLFP